MQRAYTEAKTSAMLVPPVCFTCGVSLGDLAPIYRLVLEKRMRSRYGDDAEESVAPTMIAQDPSRRENLMADVLDALRLQQCCRTHMVTAMDFRKYY